jgi:hypothetical protein
MAVYSRAKTVKLVVFADLNRNSLFSLSNQNAPHGAHR